MAQEEPPGYSGPLQDITDATPKTVSSAQTINPPSIRRAASSRFSMLLEKSVDYTAYRQECRRQRLQQPPHFESLSDAEDELKSVLHDPAFEQPDADGLVAAENVALVVDWFTNALVRQFSGSEPFENPDFLRFCCMFFASPLYENNMRLVQRHLAKRSYAELNVEEGEYADTLWLLLALLHLINEFQPDTYRLCTDSGLFPLLQRLVIAGADKNLHVLAMSLMFEISQAERLSQADLASVTDELLLFLLDYIEQMRYADSDIYNNTATKLVLALNEQMLALMPPPQLSSFGDQQTLALLASSAQRSYKRRPRRNLHQPNGSMSVQSLSPPPEHQPLPLLGAANAVTSTARPHHIRTASLSISEDAPAACLAQPQLLPAIHALEIENRLISRSRSMDFRAQLRRRLSETEQPARPSSEAYSQAEASQEDDIQPPKTRVVDILAQRTNCCKTFAENLVFLLNRETDPDTQRLVLNMLASILADPGTSEILYTNDMHVLTDIIIRDLSNVCDAEQRLRRSYLQVVCVLLRNPVYLAARHRLSDIELCLVSMLRQSLVSSHASALPAMSRRGSISESNTRHSSMVVSDCGRSATDLARRSETASPALSLTSTASEETCCTGTSRATSDQQRPLSSASSISSRRPPPPPPPARPARQRPQGAAPQISSSLRPPSQHRRRRAPPPPPNAQAQAPPLASPHLKPTAACSEPPSPKPMRRKAPPPPPPRRSRPSSSRSAKPPTPPPRTDLHKKSEQTGIRRQLSVKKSVSRYKRNSTLGKPTPPPRKEAGQMPSLVETTDEQTEDKGMLGSGSETHVEAADSDEETTAESSSAEERRATRMMVASALRRCHEARVLALSLNPALGASG
ncbi:pre-rRNA processing [Coemansia sp. RSA 989]|nr:pre-rRNA processing [Coemansia sp. RSA 989]KAJ1875711.1 pre-rRNA processing [Coemansia sp. RSA 990]